MLAVQEIKLAGGLASTHALIKEEAPGVRRLLVDVYAYIYLDGKRDNYTYTCKARFVFGRTCICTRDSFVLAEQDCTTRRRGRSGLGKSCSVIPGKTSHPIYIYV
jgi:hypothetical protein